MTDLPDSTQRPQPENTTATPPRRTASPLAKQMDAQQAREQRRVQNAQARATKKAHRAQVREQKKAHAEKVREADRLIRKHAPEVQKRKDEVSDFLTVVTTQLRTQYVFEGYLAGKSKEQVQEEVESTVNAVWTDVDGNESPDHEFQVTPTMEEEGELYIRVSATGSCVSACSHSGVDQDRYQMAIQNMLRSGEFFSGWVKRIHVLIPEEHQLASKGSLITACKNFTTSPDGTPPESLPGMAELEEQPQSRGGQGQREPSSPPPPTRDMNGPGSSSRGSGPSDPTKPVAFDFLA